MNITRKLAQQGPRPIRGLSTKKETKHSRYRHKMREAGCCPHCGKPCAPYYECEERRLAKRLNAARAQERYELKIRQKYQEDVRQCTAAIQRHGDGMETARILSHKPWAPRSDAGWKAIREHTTWMEAWEETLRGTKAEWKLRKRTGHSDSYPSWERRKE